MSLNLHDLVHNFIFIDSLAAFVVSQILKAIIVLIRMQDQRKKKAAVALFWSTGGMPSSHSALVSAMTTSAAIMEGLGSPLFAVTFFFAMVIIRDALGVRRAAGQQAKALNVLGAALAERVGFEWQPVKEIQGHNPLEVSCGILLGFVVTVACYKTPVFTLITG
jgi:acid phosphatase family membrane protein YuiD